MNKKSQVKEIKSFNLRYWTTTRRYLLIAIAFALLAVALVVFGIVPTINQLLEDRSDIAAETTKLDRLRQKLVALDEPDTLAVIQAADQINLALPSNKPLLEFMTAINDSAISNQVGVVDIQISPGLISTQSAQASPIGNAGRNRPSTRAPAEYESLVLALRVLGSLDSINQFLQSMERSVPITNVTKISLNEQTSRATGEVSFDAEVLLTTYFYTRSVSAAVEAPLPQIDTDSLNFLQELSSFNFPNVGAPSIITGGGSNDLFGLDQAQELLSE